MKIAIILISRGSTGLERAVYSLVDNLKLKNDVLLFINNEMLEYYKDIKGIKIFSLGKYSIKNFFTIQGSLYNLKNSLLDYINLEQPEIISVHSSVSMAVYSFIAEKCNVPMIPTFHGTDINNFIYKKNIIYGIAVRPKINKVLNYSLGITSVSNHQIQNLSEKYKSKTVVISNGVDSKTFKPLRNIKQKKNVILFTGNFIELKGIKEIINVAKQLPQYEFWFAGQGPLANLINLQNTKNLGFKSTEELVKLYNRATICIFPSHREGFPLCGLEAMACGKPVIATPLGFSEYIENGKDGIIIPAKDEKALKESIINLMTDEKLREKLEKNAREKALKHSWNKVAEQYLQVFKEVIKNKNEKLN